MAHETRRGAAPGAPGISVCMPAYNEAANLPGMVEEASRALAGRFERIEIVVVDDGSTDRTAEVLQDLEHRFPALRVVRHARNLGYGAAARTALSAADGELILFTDSDRQFSVEDVGPFLKEIETCDMVIGFRAPRRDPPGRVLAGRAWTGLANVLCGYVARDVNCAFKLLRRAAWQAVEPAMGTRGATFSAEWLARSRRAGLRIQELPVPHHPRPAGKATGMRAGVLARAVLELVWLRARLGRRSAGPG
jgi:glycosyltransferase involved in cell wall biosynthesis